MIHSSPQLLLVIALPIFGAVLIGLVGRKIPAAAGWIATAFAFGALFVGGRLALSVIESNGTLAYRAVAWTFFATESLAVDVAFRLDALSSIMLLVVLGVGSLIHFYSIEYMAHDPGRARFFAYLNMFIAFMLILILGDNLFMLFIGWEGVGLASYCLIGFWYEKEAPRRAAIKAFITNRVGDLSFILGLLTLAMLTGTASFDDIRSMVAGSAGIEPYRVNICGFGVSLFNVIALLLFGGACAKSAQFPLHVWLPDAMEGPTPVSALIHAATMVTAGVYMVVRLDFVFAEAHFAREVMVTIAVITALGAAISALTQTDLKRILAYSTISQLGYMMAAAAVGARNAAIFHLATHAIFKALLFLAAGSVMHALSGGLDIRKMGGLMKRIPATSCVLIIGALGLAGAWPLAGFFSKDEILLGVGHEHPVHAFLLYVAALITALYSARMVTVALFGKERFGHETSYHCHESGWIVLAPLFLLAGGTLIAGRLGHPIADLLPSGEIHHSSLVFIASIIGPLALLAAGWWHYRDHIPAPNGELEFARSGFRIDDLYDRLFIRPFVSLAQWVKDTLDGSAVDGSAEGLVGLGRTSAESMSVFQTGNLGTYLSYVAGGVVILIWIILP